MGLFLKADGAAGAAYVEADLGSDYSELWVTCRVMFSASSLAFWLGGGSGIFVLGWNASRNTGDPGLLVNNVPQWQTNQDAAGTPVADEWHLIEIHWVLSGTVDTYVDGDLVTTGPDAAGNARRYLQFGTQFGSADPEEVAYFDDIAIGTTRGAGDIFGDNFENGNLDAWSATSGDVSIEGDADPIGIAIAPNDPTFDENPAWVRLDDPARPWRVTGFEITRGKASEFDRNEPGRATIFLIDRDGSFDPTNPDAPFPLTVAAQAKITVQNPVTGEWRHLFTGFTKDYPGDFYTTGLRAEVALDLGDGFDYLNGVLMSPTDPVRFGDDPPAGIGRTLYYAETDGTGQVRARLTQALDNADWPSGWRHIFSGNISLQAWQYPVGTPLMTVLEEAVEAEFPAVGVHFMSRRGNYVFRGRYPRFDPDSYLSDDGDDIRAGPAGEGGRLVRWTVGGRPQAEANPGTEAEGYRDGTAVIADLAYRHSWEDVINAAVATPEGVDDTDVPENLYTDTASIAQYGWRFGPDMANLLVLHGNTPPGRNAVEETRLYAEYWVENFKQPVTRLTRLLLRTRDATDQLAPALYACMFGVELGDPVHVTTDHYGREGFDADYFIEGIRYRATNLGRPGLPDIELELEVSPAGAYSHNPWGTTEDGDVPAT